MEQKQLDITSKVFWPLDKLQTWKKNPRDITKDDYERLKKQIIKLGQYKPLIVNSGKHIPIEGEVLGGNMRLKAYQELGVNDIWVSLVDPKSEAEELEYALSDNDRAGHYVADKLSELSFSLKDGLVLTDYHVDLGKTLNLRSLLEHDVGLPDENQQEPEAYDGFVVVLKIPNDKFPLVKEKLENLCTEYGIEINIS